MDLLKFLDARLGEPSTYTAIAALLLAAHVSVDPGLWHTITIWGGVGAGLLGVVLAEVGTKPPTAIAGDVLAALLAGLKTLAPAPVQAAPPPPTAASPAAAPIAAMLGLVLLASTLGACTPAQQAAAKAALPAAATLADLAAANSTTVASLLEKGQAICVGGGGYFALATSFAAPSSVIGMAGEAVSAACKAIDSAAIPTPAPAGIPATMIPVEVVPAAKALPPIA